MLVLNLKEWSLNSKFSTPRKFFAKSEPLFLLVAAVLVGSGCDPAHGSVIIDNKSDQDIKIRVFGRTDESRTIPAHSRTEAMDGLFIVGSEEITFLNGHTGATILKRGFSGNGPFSKLDGNALTVIYPPIWKNAYPGYQRSISAGATGKSLRCQFGRSLGP